MVEDTDTDKEEKIEEKEEVKEDYPEGFYLGEVITGRENIIAFKGKAIDEKELLAKIANAVEKAGLMK